MDQLEAALGAFQDTFKKEREVTNAGYIETQKRLDKVEYRQFSADQEIRQLNEVKKY